MAKKRYCKKCEKLIEEGKEIKVHKEGNYRSSRYSSGPRDCYIYYLCWKCHQQQQEETEAKNEKVWQQVGWGLLALVIVIIVLVAAFLLYQHQQDKKLDRITKKASKK